jgi:hypothetical protein
LSRITAGMVGVGVLLTGWMVRRLTTSRQLSRKILRHARGAAAVASPLLALEPLAAKWIGPRPECQSLAPWISALGGAIPGIAAPLGEALALHRRARFDPHGLNAPESARLAALAVELQKSLKRRA